MWEPQPSAPDHCDAFQVSECGNTTGEPITECDVTTTTVTTTTTTTTTILSPCTAAPMHGCRLPVESRKARLHLKDKPADTADTVKWTWRKGAATTLGEFGDPLSTTDYVACLYNRIPELMMALRIPHGELCGDVPCWKRKGETAFRYADRDATRDGVRKVILRSGPAGKAEVSLIAKGASVPMPAFRFFPPVRMQLQANGLCWEAIYSSNPQISTSAEWKGRAD